MNLSHAALTAEAGAEGRSKGTCNTASEGVSEGFMVTDFC